MYRHSTLFHIYKSLTWFDDAENDAEIDAFDDKVSWEVVKSYIVKAVEDTL